MDDIFEGIDLEQLAASEQPIFDAKVGAPAPPTSKTTKKENEEKQTVEPEEVSGIDIEALANSTTEIIDINDGSKQEEEKIKTSTKTPAYITDKGSSPSSQDTFTSLASALVEAGVFSSLTEEDVKEVTSVEKLLEAVGKQVKEDRYKDLNEDQKAYLEALEHGIPQEEFALRKANANMYKNLSDEEIKKNPNLQKELFKRTFLVKGFDVKEAEKFAMLAVSQATGGEDAINAKNSLIAHEEKTLEAKILSSKQKTQQEAEAEKVKLAKLKSKVEETSEILPGIKVNSPTKLKIFESITTPIGMLENKPQNEVMEAYLKDENYKIKMHALHVLTKGLTDFSKFTQTRTSDASAKLEEVIKQGAHLHSGNPIRTSSTSTVGETASKIAEQINRKNF